MIAQHFIDGAWSDIGERIAVEDPGTGESMGEVVLADPSCVDKAVVAADACARRGDLTRSRPAYRLSLMLQMAAAIRAVTEEGAEVLCRESGKPLRDARGEFEEAARYFEYYGGMADKLEGRSIPLGEDYFDWTMREPHGVSAHIVPWNFPVGIAARSLAAGLAAGNCVVLKSPELTPLALCILVKALASTDLPPGAINLISGDGAMTGEALVRHPLVQHIVFTGSVPTGRAILRAAAERIVPCVMELGGKSAAVVHADADIDTVVASVESGVFFNAGQVCSAMARLIVHESLHDRLVDAIAARAKALEIGHGLDDPDLSALISAPQLERVEQHCADAITQGAKAVTGGHRVRRAGYFMQPTVFTHVAPNMRVANDEIFGPVISLMPFADTTEAITLANGTDYGLVAGVFGQDLNRTLDTARQLEASQEFVNEWFAGGVETPFGGTGQSGYGREKGLEALDNHLRTRNIAVRLNR